MDVPAPARLRADQTVGFQNIEGTPDGRSGDPVSSDQFRLARQGRTGREPARLDRFTEPVCDLPITRQHGIAAAYAPVLHLRRVELSGTFAIYIDCFERVWVDAAPMSRTDVRVVSAGG
jgi:hypothetical protein